MLAYIALCEDFQVGLLKGETMTSLRLTISLRFQIACHGVTIGFKADFPLVAGFRTDAFSRHSSLKFSLLFARKANWISWFMTGSVCWHGMFEVLG